ncbi:uncharacterized protein [Antedon mediterranea]|uniref:uncharacterized protein isoform X2 n=1 Tax=Antedon mediterranea TaxID=105859 RepID=UPI003AF77B19
MDPFEQRLRRVRESATARERKRLLLVNDAYTRLSNVLPQDFIGNGTKLDILRGAVRYIQLLDLQLSKYEMRQAKTLNQCIECGTDSKMVVNSSDRSNHQRTRYSFDTCSTEAHSHDITAAPSTACALMQSTVIARSNTGL